MTTSTFDITLKNARYTYDSQLEDLIGIMLEPKKEKRATISRIISDPIIVRQYHENYFKFEI